MSNPTILHVLCEGPTEQGFVNAVLRPYLMNRGIFAVKSVIVTTNKKLSITGGLISYLQAKRDLDIMMRSCQNKGYEQHVFTTMFDLYALPTDFPKYRYCKQIQNKYSQVEALEVAFGQDIGGNSFIPYIQLHEFEALIFCGINFLMDLYPGCERQCRELNTVLTSVVSPELINDKPETAPSKRIKKAIDGKYSYNKPKTGKYVTGQVGIDVLRTKCRHFDDWINRILTVSGFV